MLSKKIKIVSVFMAIVMSLQIPAGAENIQSYIQRVKEQEKDFFTEARQRSESLYELSEYSYMISMNLLVLSEDIERTLENSQRMIDLLTEQTLNDKLKKKNKEKLAKVFYICSSLCLVIGSFVGIMISKLHNLYKSKTIK